MIAKNEGLPANCEAGIISFKNLKSGFLKLTEDRNTILSQELLQTFEKYLLQLIDELLNIDMPFMEKEV